MDPWSLDAVPLGSLGGMIPLDLIPSQEVQYVQPKTQTLMSKALSFDVVSGYFQASFSVDGNPLILNIPKGDYFRAFKASMSHRNPTCEIKTNNDYTIKKNNRMISKQPFLHDWEKIVHGEVERSVAILNLIDSLGIFDVVFKINKFIFRVPIVTAFKKGDAIYTLVVNPQSEEIMPLMELYAKLVHKIYFTMGLGDYEADMASKSIRSTARKDFHYNIFVVTHDVQDDQIDSLILKQGVNFKRFFRNTFHRQKTENMKTAVLVARAACVDGNVLMHPPGLSVCARSKVGLLEWVVSNPFSKVTTCEIGCRCGRVHPGPTATSESILMGVISQKPEGLNKIISKEPIRKFLTSCKHFKFSRNGQIILRHSQGDRKINPESLAEFIHNDNSLDFLAQENTNAPTYVMQSHFTKTLEDSRKKHNEFRKNLNSHFPEYKANKYSKLHPKKKKKPKSAPITTGKKLVKRKRIVRINAVVDEDTCTDAPRVRKRTYVKKKTKRKRRTKKKNPEAGDEEPRQVFKESQIIKEQNSIEIIEERKRPAAMPETLFISIVDIDDTSKFLTIPKKTGDNIEISHSTVAEDMSTLTGFWREIME